MASIINAERSTIVGTVEQIKQFLTVLSKGTSIVNMEGSNFVILKSPVSDQQLRSALMITPKR